MASADCAQSDGDKDGERIAKVVARSGLCSRRDAEAWITAGRVSVNGVLIESAALDVKPTDKIAVDGAPLPARDVPRLWRYHKPKGRVTTHKDPQGRPTVFEALPEHLPRLISVGRLDFNTEGLLLLTNDGDVARHMELPSTGWTRRYRVRAYGEVEQSALDKLTEGLTVDGVTYGSIEAKLEREQGENVWIALSIKEGKNREVRRILEHLGLTVNRLIRVSFGPFMLGDLEPGQLEEVNARVLRDQLGPRLSKQFGVQRSTLENSTRAKPGYLRRKVEPLAPQREEEPPVFKRRRILPMDGTSGDTIKVEVKEIKKPRKFGKPQYAKDGARSGPREDRERTTVGERRPRRPLTARPVPAPQADYDERHYSKPLAEREPTIRAHANTGRTDRPEPKRGWTPNTSAMTPSTGDDARPRREFRPKRDNADIGRGDRPSRPPFRKPDDRARPEFREKREPRPLRTDFESKTAQRSERQDRGNDRPPPRERRDFKTGGSAPREKREFRSPRAASERPREFRRDQPPPGERRDFKDARVAPGDRREFVPSATSDKPREFRPARPKPDGARDFRGERPRSAEQRTFKPKTGEGGVGRGLRDGDRPSRDGKPFRPRAQAEGGQRMGKPRFKPRDGASSGPRNPRSKHDAGRTDKP